MNVVQLKDVFLLCENRSICSILYFCFPYIRKGSRVLLLLSARKTCEVVWLIKRGGGSFPGVRTVVYDVSREAVKSSTVYFTLNISVFVSVVWLKNEVLHVGIKKEKLFFFFDLIVSRTTTKRVGREEMEDKRDWSWPWRWVHLKCSFSTVVGWVWTTSWGVCVDEEGT